MPEELAAPCREGTQGDLFRGVAVALITLFTPEGEIDPPATAGHAARLAQCGVAAVVVAGSTGEASSLERCERTALISAVRAAVPPAVPVLAGTGAPSARQAAILTVDAIEAGADAVLALSPPGSRELQAYYQRVEDAAGGRPVLAYHFPEMSAPGVPLAEFAELPVQGIKDSSEDPLDCFPK